MGERGGGLFAHARFLQPFPVVILANHSLDEVRQEVLSLGKIAGPVAATTLLIFSRSLVSMLFLSHLGKMELAGGSLALAVANITCNSILKGASVGMEPICSQAFGAKKWTLLIQTFQRTLCLLLILCIPISLLWFNMEHLFLWLGQDPDIVNIAQTYLVYSIPELFAQAHLQPLRTFLRTQGLTTPVTAACLLAVIFHVPINLFLVIYMELGVKGVALGLAWSTINMNLGLLSYLVTSKKTLKPWHGLKFLLQNLRGRPWWSLLTLSAFSCAALCLEWWWYEIMLFLCGFLGSKSKASICAMSILIQTAGLFYALPFSLSTSLSTCVGHALGKAQPSRAQLIFAIGLMSSLVLGFFTLIFMIFMRSQWGRIFSSEPEILDLVSSALPILGLCELINAPLTAVHGVLTGMARPDLGARIKLISFYIIGMPIAILMAFKCEFGLKGLWFGLLASQLSCASMMVYSRKKMDLMRLAKTGDELSLAAADKDDKDS